MRHRGAVIGPMTLPRRCLGTATGLRPFRDQAPPRGAGGAAVKNAEFELRLQTFKKEGSKDTAAVGTAEIRAGNNTETYGLFLEAPEGNFAAANEFTVENDEIVETESCGQQRGGACKETALLSAPARS
jgi:hypothetical protein